MTKDEALAQLDAIFAVTREHDWDSYGAEPIAQEPFDLARSFITLRPNHIENVSAFDGGTQIIYRRDPWSVEIDINNDGEYGYLIIARVNGHDGVYNEGDNVPEIVCDTLVATLIDNVFARQEQS